MIKFNARNLPIITDIYKIERHTVWSIIEKDNLFILVNGGECNFVVNDKKYLLKKGDCIIIPANTFYARSPANENSYSLYYVHFILDCNNITLSKAQEELYNIKYSFEEELYQRQTYIHIDVIYVFEKIYLDKYYAKTVELLNEMLSLIEDKNYLSMTSCSMIFSHILSNASIISNNKLQQNMTADIQFDNIANAPEYLKKSIFYIKTHLSEKITLEYLSNMLSISSQQLIRGFKKYFATTPNQYIINYKINRAKDILMHQNKITIKETALELGFEDQCYFSRIFTKITGESPTKYQNRVINFDVKK